MLGLKRLYMAVMMRAHALKGCDFSCTLLLPWRAFASPITQVNGVGAYNAACSFTRSPALIGPSLSACLSQCRCALR